MKTSPSRPYLDEAYHYPTELFELLVQAIPSLCASKQSVIDFFRGAGAPPQALGIWQERVKKDKNSVKKSEMARDILRELNEGGDGALKQRREVIKRVTEFDDFTACWESDRLKAEALVYKIRALVDKKDSFTRMNIERERERREKQEAHRATIEAISKGAAEREAIRKDLYALFGEQNPQKRGKALESVLNRLFGASGILVREAFIVRSEFAAGVVEQIDGAVEIEGHLYLTEVKWWKEPIGRGDLAPHLVSVYSRADVRGIFISASGFSESAILDATTALSSRVYVLMDLEEIVRLLDQGGDLKRVLLEKVRAALADKQPFFKGYKIV